MIEDHVPPPSKLIVAPPSLPLIIRRESAGSLHRAWVSPCGRRMRENVRPPSVDFHVERFIRNTVFVSDGSAVTTLESDGLAIQRWSPLVRCHVAPPSSERKIPPVESSGGHSIVAYTRCGLAGDTVIPMRPSGFFGMPALREISRQVSPPSVVFHRLPFPAVNPHGVRCMCHSAAYAMRELPGSIAMSIAPVESSLYSTRCQLLPPSLDR